MTFARVQGTMAVAVKTYERCQRMSDMYYTLKVAGLERQLPLCPIGDDMMIGAFVIFGDTELTMACARELNKLVPEHDVMITAESKGIPLICEMARLAGERRYLLARKSPKLYMRDVFSTEVRSITTGHRQILCLDGKDAEYIKGKRVVIVDDVISTGESLRALEELVNHAGGDHLSVHAAAVSQRWNAHRVDSGVGRGARSSPAFFCKISRGHQPRPPRPRLTM